MDQSKSALEERNITYCACHPLIAGYIIIVIIIIWLKAHPFAFPHLILPSVNEYPSLQPIGIWTSADLAGQLIVTIVNADDGQSSMRYPARNVHLYNAPSTAPTEVLWKGVHDVIDLAFSNDLHKATHTRPWTHKYPRIEVMSDRSIHSPHSPRISHLA